MPPLGVGAATCHRHSCGTLWKTSKPKDHKLQQLELRITARSRVAHIYKTTQPRSADRRRQHRHVSEQIPSVAAGQLYVAVPAGSVVGIANTWFALTVYLTMLASFTAAFACFLLYVRPMLQAMEGAAREVQTTAQQMQGLAVDVQKTSQIINTHLPSTLVALQDTSMEVEELTRTLNRLTMIARPMALLLAWTSPRESGRLQKSKDDSNVWGAYARVGNVTQGELSAVAVEVEVPTTPDANRHLRTQETSIQAKLLSSINCVVQRVKEMMPKL